MFHAFEDTLAEFDKVKTANTNLVNYWADQSKKMIDLTVNTLTVAQKQQEALLDVYTSFWSAALKTSQK